MQTRSVAIACGLLLAVLGAAGVASEGDSGSAADRSSAADSPSGADAANAEKDPTIVPLYRFYNTKRFFHVYAYKQGQLEAFRKMEQMEQQKIIGYVLTKEEPGTQRLWRAVRSDGRHYYYVQAPRRISKNVRVHAREFQVYVWKRGGDGRVPIFANSWTDGTDMYFDPDKKRIEKFAENTKKALGVTRPDYGLVFYVQKEPPQNAQQAAPKSQPSCRCP